MDAAKLTRYAALVSMTVLAFVVIAVMQSKFDGADRRAALNIVQSTAAKNGHTVVDAIEARHPGKVPEWSVETESACFQHQRVHVIVPADPKTAPVVYDFVVDINGPSIHPGNPAGEEALALMHQLPAAAPAPAASAPAVSAPAVSAPAVSAPAVSAPAVSAPAVSAPATPPSSPSSAPPSP